MKKLTFLTAALLCCTAVFAENAAPDQVSYQRPELFNWSLLWSGSWEESRTLHNRGEIKLNILPFDLLVRAQILDRRPLNFELDSPWGDPEKQITHYTGGLYHTPTGSRLLYGVLDEWGLPARIRNPWIRSPPYAENHSPIIADIKTAASSTKEDEIYLYLSSPLLEVFPNVRMRGFVSAQAEIDDFTEHGLSPEVSPAFSGGLDFTFINTSLPRAQANRASSRLLLETFYTGETLPPKTISTWFSYPPPLPEREFQLYAFALLFTNPAFSISSDFAMSETFAWGTDIYANIGVSFSPSLTIGTRARPLLVSFAVDGSGERFVNRDGANLNEGFRCAAKIEWRSRYNSLLRLSSVLRGPGPGEDFNRSSTGFFYRFPAAARGDNSFFRLTRISFSADRNAVNPEKINDSYSGSLGLRINNVLGVNLSGSVKGLAASEDSPVPFPIADESWKWDSTSASCEFIWSPGIYQFRLKTGNTLTAGKDEKWDFSVSASARFKQGRLSFKLAYPDFPNKWNCTVSWRLEIRER